LSDSQFFLKYLDNKDNSIFVNNSFDIVEVIDWEWTYMVSKANAFYSLYIMWPMIKFYSSSNELDVNRIQSTDIFWEKIVKISPTMLLKVENSRDSFLLLDPIALLWTKRYSQISS